MSDGNLWESETVWNLHTVSCVRAIRPHTHIDSREKKAILGPFAASALFAYHTTILFSHDMLEANTFHIK